jgi:hypothetical protein
LGGRLVREAGGLLLPTLLCAATLPELGPQVSSLFPLGGRAGEAIEVRISGRHLDGTMEVRFARPDLRAELVSAGPGEVKVRISIGAGVPTGLHDYRLRTPRGAFTGVLHVSSLAAMAEAEPNNTAGTGQKVELPAMIDGVVTSGDSDVFGFHAEEGQRLVFDLLARRAGSSLDATLALLDEGGNELDFNDDSYIHKDPHLAMAVRRTGRYFVRVSGTSESGSPGSTYRLIAGAVPYIYRVLPGGAKRGGSTEISIAGLNLDKVDRLMLGEGLGEGVELKAEPKWLKFRLNVPAGVTTGTHALRLFSRGVEAPLPFPIVVSDLEETLAAGLSRANPEPVKWPVAISGVLEKRRAAHFFTFEVQAGERLVFEADAMKLGYLVDPVVAIYSLDGKLLAHDDDRLEQNGSHPPNLDPYLVHSFERGGRYVAMVRDLAERGDPNYLYRLAIYRGEADFDLKGLVPTVTLYRGQTVEIPVRVRRHGGWDTPVEVWVENPPPGVTAGKRIAEAVPTIVVDNCALKRRLDGTNVDLPVTAEAGATPGLYPLRVRGRGVSGGRTVEHSAEIQFAWETVGKVTGPVSEQSIFATITDLPPVLLEAPARVALWPGKTARLRVLITRFDGAARPLSLSSEPVVAGLTLENHIVAPGASRIELVLKAEDSLRSTSFRLRAGDALSEPIKLEMRSGEAGQR